MRLFGTVILLCILGGVETDLFIPSFPELRETFNLTPFMVQLTLSLNFIAYCVCALFAGMLGDKYNARHVIIISLLVFVGGSIFTVAATNFPILLTGRLLQGIGIAAPTTLAYVIISDKYPLARQPALLGIISGVTTISMAFAPTIGSYINLFFDWRGNFAALLILGVICLVMSFLFFPDRKGNPAISLSPRMYFPLLKSKVLMTYCAAIVFLVTPYFLFVGMSSLLYIEAFKVPLAHFGYYQGAIAGIFAVISFSCARIYAVFGQKRCFEWGTAITILAGILALILAILDVRYPLLITLNMMLVAAGAIFPINILYPHSLHVIEGAKSRASALMMAARLIIVSLALGIVSIFYNDSFLYIGLGVTFFLVLALPCLYLLLRKKWISFD
ncbi:MAG: MFS-type bicyclomycin resistance protein [Gammaproteobacteria bacterium]|jgi:DHA1 family bicyclomycin/chloramphenicol resistance-like MFS transporter|nr:MFS-type bicyclomycin resistance protein [Gammaproteobacteria bacterium]